MTIDNNNESPAKRQKTTEGSTSTDTGNEQNSLFKGISEKFKVKEKIDTAVDAELAEIINGLFANGLPDIKLTELLKMLKGQRIVIC